MRYEQISAAITRFTAVTAVRGFIGTETIVHALRLHLSMVRMSLGMLRYSRSASQDGCMPLCDVRDRDLKRNVKLAINKQGNSPWQQSLSLAIHPAAGLRLASC